jgi:hypothetical protein
MKKLTKFATPLSVFIFLIAFSISAFAQPAPKPTPTPKPDSLTQVAHDSTLTGAGTTASPLGIADSGVGTSKIANAAVTNNKVADGAITSSKLSTLATPAAGSALTFNGTGLAWQTPTGSGGLRVVDSTGKELGFFSGSSEFNAAIGHIGSLDLWLRFKLDGTGLLNDSLWFPTTDCSGIPYAPLAPSSLLHDAFVNGELVYWAKAQQLYIIVQSRKDPVGPCEPSLGYSGFFVPLSSFPLSDLELTPPFKLSR